MNKGELEEDMVRHMILNSVRMYRTMFNEDYGEIVLVIRFKSPIGVKRYFHNTNQIVEKIEKKMIKIGIPYLMFLIISKKK